jgi:hypothetical protein
MRETHEKKRRKKGIYANMLICFKKNITFAVVFKLKEGVKTSFFVVGR